jgi:hypothetical protein
MAEYKILIEGQTIPVPEEIGANDETVKKALSQCFPDAANAMITRTEKDGVIIVNVIKKAGTKGGALDALLACEERKNPAIALHEELRREYPRGMTAEALLEMNERIESALQDGRAQEQQIDTALTRLMKAQPVPAVAVVMGF